LESPKQKSQRFIFPFFAKNILDLSMRKKFGKMIQASTYVQSFEESIQYLCMYKLIATTGVFPEEMFPKGADLSVNIETSKKTCPVLLPNLSEQSR
jgi:hypothetical protein